MRRPRGSGSVVRIGDGYRARMRRQGTEEFGPTRSSWQEADADRAKLADSSSSRAAKRREIPTLTEWAERCQRGAHGRNLSAAALETNEAVRLQHLKGSTLGATRLDRITGAMCQEWVDDFGRRTWRSKPEAPEKPYSAASVARYWRAVSSWLSLARRAGLIREHPGRDVLLPRVQPGAKRQVPPDLVPTFMPPEDRYDLAICFGLYCGLRIGEVRLLEWTDLDEAKGLLSIRGTKSTGARRVVPVPAQLVRVLRAWPRASAYVLAMPSGKPPSVDHLRRQMVARLPAGVKPHDLRGTYISLLIESGTGVRDVMELVGHSSPDTTLKVYARGRMEAKRAAVEQILGPEKQVDASGTDSE